MRQKVSLRRESPGFLASRFAARPYREEIAGCLAFDREVAVDFGCVSVTTSFIDEVVGGLIITHGPSVIDRLVFENCDAVTRRLLEFVVATRLAEIEPAPALDQNGSESEFVHA